MTEPASKMEDALSRVQPRWDVERTERTLGDLARRRRRRQVRPVLAVSLAACAFVTLGVLFAHRVRSPDTSASTSGMPTPPAQSTNSSVVHGGRLLRLTDGSRVEVLDSKTRIVKLEDSAAVVLLALAQGHAQFDVARRANRVFRVRSGDVSVEVIGTRFVLQRVGTRTHVAVERGRVAVSWPSGRRELAAGEADWFPPAREAEDVEAESEVGAADEPFAAERAPRVEPKTSWRDHAELGEFKRAYELLESSKQPVGSTVSELMLAADAARLSGHPAESVGFLRRVISEHPRDARAPLAAFTLGNVLMNQLGQPREAEAAYRIARQASSSAALSQDALARQVEAAHRAGDDVLARRLAERYVREYPRGRRLGAVRRFGGLQ